MKSGRRFALLAVPLALMLSAQAHAKPKTGIEGWGGWNRYNMSEVNDTLSAFNTEYGTGLAPIRDSHSWGLGLRLWPRENVLVRVGYERIPARTRDSGVEFDLGAHALMVSVTRFTPSLSRVRWGAGLGLGPLFARGGLTVPGAWVSTSGTGFTGHVTGEALVALGGGVSLNGTLGYRFAGIPSMKFGEYTSDLSTHYSGFFIRAGLALDGSADD